MAAHLPESTGAYASAEVEVKPRIRVRLHFGGTFAQDGPRQWRYVGGEVYNESFPMDSKYAEVSKRLNDKFGDPVSFKYLCPGDDVDPDNLVQVQGDDDLREMCDEYQNALQKPSTPVKTMRIKVFVFRAVIFEREVQELDEDLVDEDELMTVPEDGEPVSSCDHECGPNWSDWGEPDELEVTESSMPSAHLSSDAEFHASSAAVAATSLVGLHYSTSVNSTISGKTAAQLTFPMSISAGQAPVSVLGGIFVQRPSAGVSTAESGRSHGAGILTGDVGTGRPSALGTWQGGCQGGGGFGLGHYEEAEGRGMTPVVAAAAAGGPVDGRSCEAAVARTGCAESDHTGSEEKLKLERKDIHGCSSVTAEVNSAPATAGGQTEGGKSAEYDQVGVQNRMADLQGPARCARSETGQLVYHGERLNQEEGNSDRVIGGDLPDPEKLQVDGQDREQRELIDLEQEQQHIEQERWQSPRLELAAQVVVEQQQECQHSLYHSQPEEESGAMGFFCDEELEDPYGEQYEDGSAAVAGAGLYSMHKPDADAAAGRLWDGDGSANDGPVHAQPRAADVNTRGNDGREPTPGLAKGGDAGVGGAVKGLLARLPAVVDFLPRHISAFGESSRDESQGIGSGACVIGNGHFLPSRITIFGDDAASAGGGSSVAAGLAGGGGAGLHRLALMGAAGDKLVFIGRGRGMAGAGPSAWPGPGAPPPGCSTAAGTASHRAGGPGGFSMAQVADDLLPGDSRLCITQEFGAKHRSSMMEPEGLDGGCSVAVGGEGGGGGRGGRMSPLDPLDPMDPLLRMGLGGGGLGQDGLLDSLSPSSVHNHPLRGVVKKRKSEVTIMAKIGEGAFGEVSQAQVFPYGIVAVKWLKRERFAKYSESFQREAETLAKLNHPNIIRMYGLVMDTPDTPSFGSGGGATPQCGHNASGGSGGGCGGGSGTPTGLIGGIITEFVRNGSLGQYLRSLNGRRLSVRQRAMIALQASLGMAYLHEQSPAVVHFDLKPDNLLVDGEGDTMVIKVADFGLSKHKLSNYVSCRDLRGTLPYMAFELVSNAGHISEKVDVYSMGVVMWEMYTGEPPFAHLSAQEILSGLLHGNLHLALPPTCEPEWRSLVETCMDPDPAARPSFQELAMQLQEMMRLERQSSNASSVSVSAAAAAAAAAVLESASDETCDGESGGGLVGAGAQGLAEAGHWRLPGLGLPGGGGIAPPPPQPAALLGPAGGAGAGLAAENPAKQMLAQVLQGHSLPLLAQAPPPPPALLMRPQAAPMPSPPQLPLPQLLQQPQHHHHPLSPLMAAAGPSPPPPPSGPHPGALPPFQHPHQPYRHVQFALAPSPAAQQRPPVLAPPGPQQPQPPQHLVFMRQQLGAPLTNPAPPLPSPALTGQQTSPQQPPISFPLQLPPSALFEPAALQAPQLQHMQPMGGLYGLGGGPGVAGPGLALVGWGGDRGGGAV